MFIAGFALGFLTAFALIVGVALIPVAILIGLGVLLWAYLRSKGNKERYQSSQEP